MCEPYIEFFRQVVKTGNLIGRITKASISAGFRSERRYGYPGRREWFTEPDMGGTGSWMLYGIHTIAGVRRVFGDVPCVYVQEHKTGSFQRSDLEGTVSALLTVESGVNVSVVQSPETRFVGNTGGTCCMENPGQFALEPKAMSYFPRAKIHLLVRIDCQS